MLPPSLLPERFFICGKSLRKYAKTPMVNKKTATIPTPTIFNAMMAPSALNQYCATRFGCKRYSCLSTGFFGNVDRYAARWVSRACLAAFSLSLRLRCKVIVLPLRERKLFFEMRERPDRSFFESAIYLDYAPIFGNAHVHYSNNQLRKGQTFCSLPGHNNTSVILWIRRQWLEIIQ